jgi:hypothetical protein
MRATSVLLFGLVISLAAGACSHADRPCPPQHVFVRRPPVLAPTDPTTTDAIEATGARYEVCPPGRDYLLARAGEREMTDLELTLVGAALQGLPGIELEGTGNVGCLSPSRPAPRLKVRSPGVMLRVRENSVTPVQIAQELAKVAPDGATARALVMINFAPGPRCAPDDPACEPLPHGAECVERTDYDRKGKRKFVRGGAGSCTYDGECMLGSCGNACISTAEIPVPTMCEMADEGQQDDVYCGCVQNACAWFTTK